MRPLANVLVTGGAGFIGSRRLARALALGACCWFALASAGCAGTGGQAPAPIVGSPAPSFAALDRETGPVAVAFFATWCVPCRQELPLLDREARAGHLVVVAVDYRDDSGAVPRFLAGLGVHLPNVVADADGSLAAAYRVVGVPTTFFLDRRHVIRSVAVGQLTPAEAAAGIRAATASG